MGIFTGDFESRDDVAGEFEVTLDDSINIIYADYDNGGYEGSAFVLFEQGGKLFEVNGSHCSCYGLEGQWEPEETSTEVIRLRQFSWLDKEDRDALFAALDAIDAGSCGIEANHRRIVSISTSGHIGKEGENVIDTALAHPADGCIIATWTARSGECVDRRKDATEVRPMTYEEFITEFRPAQ